MIKTYRREETSAWTATERLERWSTLSSPKETLLDKIEKSITGMAEALRNVFTGGGEHDQNRNEEGPEQSDQGND